MLLTKLTEILDDRGELSSIKQHTNEQLQENVEVSFDDIYNNFNIKKPLYNESIADTFFIGNTTKERYDIFTDFCDFLLNKINQSNTIKYVKKIPLIISNIAQFSLVGNTFKINSKRNSVMNEYNKKFKPGRKDITI